MNVIQTTRNIFKNSIIVIYYKITNSFIDRNCFETVNKMKRALEFVSTAFSNNNVYTLDI